MKPQVRIRGGKFQKMFESFHHLGIAFWGYNFTSTHPPEVGKIIISYATQKSQIRFSAFNAFSELRYPVRCRDHPGGLGIPHRVGGVETWRGGSCESFEVKTWVLSDFFGGDCWRYMLLKLKKMEFDES